ncbi:MAG: hypothetical protein U9Q38_08510, partial [Thermodesulfobacteriota bacterium]|nr:hypothetical protein [Thermodesulfobacteriota bacterium]
LGLILCAGKTNEQIELLQLNKSGIKVAEYMTELPKRKLLKQKLHKAVESARKRLEAKQKILDKLDKYLTLRLLAVKKSQKKSIFTPLESHSIYGSDEINKYLISYRKDGALYPALSNGVYFFTI